MPAAVDRTSPRTTEGSNRRAQGRVPRWQVEREARLKAALRNFRRPLVNLLARSAFERETRACVLDFLRDALGFAEEDLKRELGASFGAADYALCLNDTLVACVEVRRVAARLDLGPRPPEGAIVWLIVTNAVEWRLYHLGGARREGELVLAVDLLGREAPARKAAKLAHMTRESFERGEVDTLLRIHRALSPEALRSTLTTPVVLRSIQTELRRRTGQTIPAKTIARLLEDDVLPTPGPDDGTAVDRQRVGD